MLKKKKRHDHLPELTSEREKKMDINNEVVHCTAAVIEYPLIILTEDLSGMSLLMHSQHTDYVESFCC